MNDVRKRFVEAAADMADGTLTSQVLVVAVEMPNGKVETITNHGENIPVKLEYYLNAYDGDMKLKSNPDIRIRGFLLV